MEIATARTILNELLVEQVVVIQVLEDVTVGELWYPTTANCSDLPISSCTDYYLRIETGPSNEKCKPILLENKVADVVKMPCVNFIATNSMSKQDLNDYN